MEDLYYALKEGIIEALVGIIQGLKTGEKGTAFRKIRSDSNSNLIMLQLIYCLNTCLLCLPWPNKLLLIANARKV